MTRRAAWNTRVVGVVKTRSIAAAAGVLLAVLAGAGAAQTQAEAARGREVFEAKQCGRCHVQGGSNAGVPSLETLRQPQGAWELTGRFWNHVPAMFTALTAQNVPWPSFTPDEMAALMTYLGADPARDPKPDPLRGVGTLIDKGCLKCHRLRGEGGTVAPEFGERTAAFESPYVWAARIWTHTPVMAQTAMRLGVLYPRFSGNEMPHLVAYLKNARR
jgi:cytochrome c5